MRILLTVLFLFPLASGCGGRDDIAPGADAGATGCGYAPPAMPDCTGRPSTAPDTRGEINGVFDAARGRILVYGGDTAAPIMCRPQYNLVNEMWAFHLDCNTWELLTPAGGPGIRARHATTLDTTRNNMLLFGGRLRRGFGMYDNFNDVWSFDLETDTWAQIPTAGSAPTPKSTTAIAYDEGNDRLLVFGGNVSTGGLTLTGTDEMHALDIATGAWTVITAAGAPSPRLYHGGVVLGREFIIVGGTPNFGGPFLGDAHAFDMDTDTWRVIHPGGAGAPDTRFGAELFADPARDRVLMVAGHDGTDLGNRNDVWALDVTMGTWQEVRPGDTLTGMAAGVCDFPADFTTPEPGAPERRYSFVHVQCGATGYIFGGKTDCGNINDVWSLDMSAGEWTPLRPATNGEACNRSGATMCTTLCS